MNESFFNTLLLFSKNEIIQPITHVRDTSFFSFVNKMNSSGDEK